MVDFNDYKYNAKSGNNIDKIAAQIDGTKGTKKNGTIDGNEKSIFLEKAIEAVKAGDLDETQFKKIFGADFKEDLKYTPKADAKNAGKGIANRTSGYTDDFRYDALNEAISPDNLDDKNIVKLLKGFYETKGSWFGIKLGNSEGIIETLDDENDSGDISMANKLNIINSLIKCAENNGMADDMDVKDLKAIVKSYSKTDKKGDFKYKNFNEGGTLDFTKGRRWASIGTGAAAGAAAGAAIGAGALSWTGIGTPFGAGVGAIGGAIVGAIAGAFDRPTHNEIIDDLMKSIYDKLVEKGVK